MNDTISRYRAASEANDIAAVMETLAPDVELTSPLSARMVFRGHDDVRVLLTAVYGSLGEFRWVEILNDGDRCVLVGDGKIGPFRLGDAMIVEFDNDGLIRRMRPHLRPWFATTYFALVLGPKVARKPAVIRRALSS